MFCSVTFSQMPIHAWLTLWILISSFFLKSFSLLFICIFYLFMYVFIHSFIYYFWQRWVLVVARRIFCCGAGSSLRGAGFSLVVVCGFSLSSCGAWAPEHVGSVVVAHGLSCPAACGILVPRPGTEPASSALEGRFFTTGPPGKSL